MCIVTEYYNFIYNFHHCFKKHNQFEFNFLTYLSFVFLFLPAFLTITWYHSLCFKNILWYFSVNQVMLNYLSFCLSKNALNSCLFLSNTFAWYKILILQSFTFTIWTYHFIVFWFLLIFWYAICYSFESNMPFLWLLLTFPLVFNAFSVFMIFLCVTLFVFSHLRFVTFPKALTWSFNGFEDSAIIFSSVTTLFFSLLDSN